MSWVGSYEENKFYQPQLLQSMYRSLPSNRRVYHDVEKGNIEEDNQVVGDHDIRYSLAPSKLALCECQY